MSAARRVLFVCDTLSGGGAERFVSTALVHLDRSRLRPGLCLFRSEVSYPLPDDVPVRVLEKTRPWHIPIAIGKLARMIDAERPDVVFSAFSHPSFVTGNALALCRHRPRWVARVSNNPDFHETGTLRAWMRQLYARADRVVCNASDLREAFARAYPGCADKAVFLPNAIDFDALERLADLLPEEDACKGPTLVAVGRLHAQKRVDRMIALLAALRERRGVRLVVCGEGPLRAALEAQVRDLGLGGRVRLLGFTDNPYAWIARADLFLLTSDWEGLPNALLEAQGLGVPAVATDCDYGPREIIAQGETGVLVPVEDPSALEAAVGALLDDEPRRRAMGEAARRRARERYAARPVVRRLEAHLLDEAPVAADGGEA